MSLPGFKVMTIFHDHRIIDTISSRIQRDRYRYRS